jgi:hypothetical protein
MSTKYKIVETTGCTAFNFTINDEPISDIPEKKQEEILDYVLGKIKEGINENTILFTDVVTLFQPDDWEHDPNVCETCGDSISTTTWKI